MTALPPETHALAHPVGAFGVAVAEGRLEQAPRGRAGRARHATAQTSTSPNGCWASSAIAPWALALLAVVTQGQLHGQPPDQQVHHAVGHQADPYGVVEQVALLGLAPDLFGVGHRFLPDSPAGDCATPCPYVPRCPRFAPRVAGERPATRRRRRREDRGNTMSESVAAQRAEFARGPAGPESLRIPAEPAQLSQAVQQLRQLRRLAQPGGGRARRSRGASPGAGRQHDLDRARRRAVERPPPPQGRRLAARARRGGRPRGPAARRRAAPRAAGSAAPLGAGARGLPGRDARRRGGPRTTARGPAREPGGEQRRTATRTGRRVGPDRPARPPRTPTP